MPSQTFLRVPSFFATVALTLTLLGGAADAQNLLSNPSFETGDLSSWTASGVSASNLAGNQTEGAFGAVMSSTAITPPGIPATLSQTITTIAGHTYFLTFDFLASGTGTQSVTVTGQTPLATQPLVAGTGFQHAFIAFTADGASATVSLNVTSIVAFASMVVDNFVAVEGAFSKAGKFTGNVRVTTSVPGKSIASSHLETLVARIDANGRLYLIVQPSGATFEGVVTNNKTVVLGGKATTATIVGALNKFTLQESFAPQTTNNPSSEAVTVTSSYLLRRVGN